MQHVISIFIYRCLLVSNIQKKKYLRRRAMPPLPHTLLLGGVFVLSIWRVAVKIHSSFFFLVYCKYFVEIGRQGVERKRAAMRVLLIDLH